MPKAHNITMTKLKARTIKWSVWTAQTWVIWPPYDNVRIEGLTDAVIDPVFLLSASKTSYIVWIVKMLTEGWSKRARWHIRSIEVLDVSEPVLMRAMSGSAEPSCRKSTHPMRPLVRHLLSEHKHPYLRSSSSMDLSLGEKRMFEWWSAWTCEIRF